MIIYVKNQDFPHRTFVLSLSRQDKVARFRAHLLHILYDIGKDDHQFKLRYKGEMLRDADYLGDYDINDNAIVSMIPTDSQMERIYSLMTLASQPSTIDLHTGQPPNIKDALNQEIKHFDKREKYLSDFKALLYINTLVILMAVLTVYWYSVAWTGLLFLLAMLFVPTYTRIGGFVGSNTHWRKYYCVLFNIGAVICLAIALYFSIITWTTIVNHGCKDWMFVDDCSHRQVFSAVLYTIHSVLLIISTVIVCLLLVNFRVETGDFIEKYLVQEKDIEKVVIIARTGRMKERRQAAYDLATLAASSNENKLLIAAEGGLQVLETLTLNKDSSTQESSLEALGELLIVPSIQEIFLRSGGCRSLLTALNSPNQRVMYEAANALYTIVSESEDNKQALIQGHGIEDLAHAGREGKVTCQRVIAGILLELTFNSEIRAQLSSTNTLVEVLTELCKSQDLDTKRFALQSLELMAIENCDLVCSQDNLIEILLDIPLKTLDEKLYLLAAKILMYFTENIETCEQLLNNTSIKESLGLFARSENPVQQRVVARIIFLTLETRSLKIQAIDMKLNKILEYIREHPADRETWDMADQGLSLMNSEDDLSNLPTLTTLEKLKKMETTHGFDTSSSATADSINSSDSDLKKHV
ncbi:hypothetical protein LOTGIDRAFT_231090 [Lottia gigantea]|uniref:Ubiquitin-like domain-containing protein n=1 Tax=Lottia gigantea TaxID=225164 RepID=V4A6D9_LOTGI|nr:hypothetical protein LOTGIDRAFT_231090 [Lottia gigantea]ESO99473.1 hypothetical protein LOTGIDRAFT_231090 [Lottia gigantea]